MINIKILLWIIVIIFVSLSVYDLILVRKEPMSLMNQGRCNGCGNAGSGELYGNCPPDCQCKRCLLNSL